MLAADVAGGGYTFAMHRELFAYLARREDVTGIYLSQAELNLTPQKRLSDDGNPWRVEVRVRIAEDAVASQWPTLLQASRQLGLSKGSDMPELGAFSLLDTHLEEAVNSMREPGPLGYEYRNGSFEPF